MWLADSGRTRRIVEMVSAQLSTDGAQQHEGSYTVRHVVSLGGDWVFARRMVAYPSRVDVRSDFSVSGPQREAAMDIFVVRVMEDILSLADASPDLVLGYIHIERVRKNDVATTAASVKNDIDGEQKGGIFGGAKAKEAAAAARAAVLRAVGDVPYTRVLSDKWSISTMRQSRASFTAAVKSAVAAKRRIWIEFYAPSFDLDDLVGPTVEEPVLERASSVTTTVRRPASVDTARTPHTTIGLTESETLRFYHWAKSYTFHFQPRLVTSSESKDTTRESFGTSPLSIMVFVPCVADFQIR